MDRMKELIAILHEDYLKNRQEVYQWTDKREQFYRSNELIDRNYKADISYINSQINDFNDKSVINEIELQLYDIYSCALCFYAAFIANNEVTMQSMKERMEKITKKIKRILDNKGNHVFYNRDVDYKTEVLTALSRLESVMYFPECPVNEYQYLTHQKDVEQFINDYKNNFIKASRSGKSK